MLAFTVLSLRLNAASKENYHCPACGTLIEELGAAHLVLYRLTVQPSTKAIRNNNASRLPRLAKELEWVRSILVSDSEFSATSP